MVNTNLIPAEMQAIAQWVLWKYEDNGGKPTKILYHPQGHKASSTSKSTWITFERAHKNYIKGLTEATMDDDKVITHYDGIGFVLADSDPFVAWDFDHCLDKAGVISEPALSYVRRLNSYTEVSPSGTGIRVITAGHLPPRGRKKGQFETYESKRFVTITGNHIEGTPNVVERRDQEILEVHREIFGDTPDPVARPASNMPMVGDDAGLVEMAKSCKGGLKFTQMYDQGDISEYPSASEARLALCGTIAFFAGPDPERIDRIFRQSALYDAKWDSTRGDTTYGALTIERALEGRTEFFGIKKVEAGEISGSVNGCPFWTKDGVTLTSILPPGKGAESVDHIFANFDLRICGLLKKVDTGAVIWRGVLTCDGESAEIELDPESVSSAGDLASIKNWPTDATVLIPRLWPLYKGWLSQTKISRKIMEERPYYGFQDVRAGCPTLLVPGVKHEKYTWRNEGEGKNLATNEMFTTVDSPETIKKYLTGLRNNMPGIHEDRYVYTVLGWLCACTLTEFLRHRQKGFPTLMISGLRGAGKSTLIESLAPHVGVESILSIGSQGTTLAAIRRFLGSNSLIPLIMDEYRTADEYKARGIQDIMRDCWNAEKFSMVGKKGENVIGFLAAPLAIAGQNHIDDDAALDRTISIRITNRAFADGLAKDKARETKALQQLDWLQKTEHDGVLGRSLLAWVTANYDSVDDILALAEQVVSSHTDLKFRRFKSYVAVVAGLLLLVQVYKQYGIKQQWLSDTLFMPAILAADTQLAHSQQSDVLTMQDLFTITDKGLVQHKMRGLNPIGTTLQFHLDQGSTKYRCKRYVYFDAKRWYGFIQEYTKKGGINLKDETTFYAMLEDQTRQEGSPIVAFGKPYGSFRVNCVKVDMDLIIEKYSINAEAWDSETEEDM